MEQQRRQKLLETATAEFANDGFEQASLNKIINACGLSKSSFYHYFASKVELFDTVVREAVDALARELEVPDLQRLTVTPFWAEIDGLFRQLLTLTDREWFIDFGKLFYLADAPMEHSPALRQATSSMAAWLEGALVAGRTSGAIRTDLPLSLQADLAIAVLKAMDSWSLRHAHEVDTDGRQALVEAQLNALQRLLAPAAAPNSSV